MSAEKRTIWDRDKLSYSVEEAESLFRLELARPTLTVTNE